MILDSKTTRLTQEGELEIDLRPAHDVYLHYTPWDKGLWIYRWTKRGWHEESEDPGFPLITENNIAKPGSAIEQFVRAIPIEIRNRVDGFFYKQTTILQWVARDKYLTDLLYCNPILLWLLVHAAQTRCWSFSEVQNISRLKQKDILIRITGHGTNANIRFLRKIVLQSGDRRELRLVQWAVKSGRLIARLHHLPEIPIHVLALLSRYSDLATGRMVHSLSSMGQRKLPQAFSHATHMRYLWNNILRIGGELHITNPKQALMRCQSFEDLYRIHARWMMILNDRKGQEKQQRKAEQLEKEKKKSNTIFFPEPPVAGTPSIRPIRSVEDLRGEGKIMDHCVAGYANKVLSGQSYIYRILQPQRATLELLLDKKPPSIGQFCLKRNRSPSRRTLKVVRDWLDESIYSGDNS